MSAWHQQQAAPAGMSHLHSADVLCRGHCSGRLQLMMFLTSELCMQFSEDPAAARRHDHVGASEAPTNIDLGDVFNRAGGDLFWLSICARAEQGSLRHSLSLHTLRNSTGTMQLPPSDRQD